VDKYIVIALGIAFIIFIHELGHFLVGKFFKFNIETFSVGFGKPLFKFNRGGTEYQLALIPLGGYVKFKGDLADELGENEDGSKGDPYDFPNRPAYQRALVLVAGVAMNAISGIGMIMVAYLIGVKEINPEIGHIEPDGPADKSQTILVGDVIKEVNGMRINNFMEVIQEIALSEDETIFVQVERDGKVIDFEVKAKSGKRGILELGMSFRRSNKVIYVHNMEEKSAAEPALKAGLKIDDLITGLRLPAQPWVEINNEDEVMDFLASEKVKEYLSVNKEIEIRYSRAGKITVASITPHTSAMLGFAVDVKTPRLIDRLTNWLSGSEPEQESRVGSLQKGTPAFGVGVVTGDLLTVAVDSAGLEHQVQKFKDLIKFLKTNGTKEFELSWKTEGGEGVVKKKMITPTLRPYSLGLSWDIKRTNKVYAFSETGPLLAHTIKRTRYEFYTLVRTIKSLFSGAVSTENLGGPIAIVQVSSRAFSLGFGYYLIFLAIISFNLAILNILPIPLLDGGHLVLVMAEAVMGRPVNEKIQLGLQYIGMALLGSLILFVFYNDLFRAG
jgi:regulator of sigma E protease